HWQATGWVGHHAGSPWAGAFVRAEGMGLLRNAAVLAWRWADLGRWVEWAAAAALLLGGAFRRDALLLRLLLLCGALALLLSPSGLLYANLSAHRYFLPLFLGLHLLVFRGVAAGFFPQTAAAAAPTWRVWAVWAWLVIALSTGHLWVYPRGVSLDWDCTWAHWPYHGQRAAALRFLRENGIAPHQVGTAFPSLNSGEHLLLDGDTSRLAPLDWQRNTYVLASNVFNDLNEPDFQRLEREWQPICSWQHPVGTWMTLYRRKP
ncbi:MAG TPA: hypothetical protein PK858_11880, partial [Saprospiraceae bacterium]|nr:hypothetical protein [Saprospiraceae bacterium]